MSDGLLAALWRQVSELPAPRLVVVDESGRDAPWPLLPIGTRILSNRWDVAEQAHAAGLDARFNDFDFSAWDSPPRSIAYRVSKEKAVVHHIINESWQRLPTAGRLLIAGEKSDGIKNYAMKAAALFQDTARARKEGSYYFCHLRRTPGTANEALLDDQNYRKIKEVAQQESGVRICGKPGLFGWDRIDAGSALLVAQLPDLLDAHPARRMLDLGCGSGYLAAMAASWCKEVVATDNNAAAIAAAQHTFATNDIVATVIAADCGLGIEPGFDLILCNPPFHQGFHHSSELTRRFLAAASRLLSHDGQALFVVNAFISLETLAMRHFSDCQVAARNRSFKVVQLRQPKSD